MGGCSELYFKYTNLMYNNIMKRNSVLYNVLLLSLIAIYPLFVLVSVQKNTLLVFSGIKTEGTVVNTTYEVSTGGRRMLGKTPTVNISYKDIDGNLFTLEETGKTNLSWKDGQSVNVYYDKNDPSKATTFTMRKVISFLALFLFLLAFLFGIRYAIKRKEGF
jgi:hypothetical protein